MKIVFKIFLLGFVTMVFFILCFTVFKGALARYNIDKNTEILPRFAFFDMKNQKFSNSSLGNVSGKIVFNYFNPDCDHCQYVAQNYVKKGYLIRNVQIIMVTTSDSATTEKFVKKYLLYTMPNIVILFDKKFEFEKIFGPSIVPSFYIYHHTKMIKKIHGETEIENLFN